MALASRLRDRLSSVGTKIAGATLLLVAVLTALGYEEVSRRERETLLSSKESAATMVARLFAAGLVAPIRFTDDAGAHDKTALLLTNDELVRAAVFSVDHDAPTSILLKLAEVQRTASYAPTPTVHRQAIVTRREAEVIVEAPVMEGDTDVIGMVQVTFSLDHERQAIRKMERRALAGAAAVSLLLTGMLLLLTRSLVITRLARLAGAARRFEQGNFAADADVLREVGTRDEVGELARAFETMSASIAVREQRISQRNRDMRRVLDNAAEGFLTVDTAGMMSDERSLVLDAWFGPAGEGLSFFDYVDRIAPDLTPWLRIGWDSLADDFMPCEVVLDQLGRRFESDGRFLELEFRPIHEQEVLAQILVVVRDVTERVERERAEVGQREATAVFRRMLADRNGFEELMSEAGALVDEIVRFQGPDLTRITRAIHTLKGVTAVFEIESVSSFCHALELRMCEERGGVSISDRQQIAALWSNIVTIHRQLGGAHRGRLEVPREDYERLLSELDHGVEAWKIASFVRTWPFERTSARLTRITTQLSSIARRLGKPDVELHTDVFPPDLRLPPERWACVWTVFSHLLRNALDHGIEGAEERRAAGKRGSGRVSVTVRADLHGVVIAITDDGRGIAWEKIRSVAQARGLPCDSRGDLEEALFADEVSSRDAMTEISGRGVGLGAVREIIRASGGRVFIASEPGRGTTFRLDFPNGMLTSGSTAPRRAMSEVA
ncbi:MAG: hypothetical protein JWP97_4923 [Labilithrix sp.]|nr:hypothetical protein [Labilithrix sp.]